MVEIQLIIVLRGRHFVRHLGRCNRICFNLIQLMWVVITRNSVRTRFLYINKWYRVAATASQLSRRSDRVAATASQRPRRSDRVAATASQRPRRSDSVAATASQRPRRSELQSIIAFRVRHFVHHFGICNRICVKLLQIMWVLLRAIR